MKGSTAFKEIEPQLECAIKNNYNYYLLVVTDICEEGRNIPLHKGNGMSKISKVIGYDENKHRWLSGYKAFHCIFGNNGNYVFNCVLETLKEISPFKTNN
jgi:hypothetical protein